MLDLKKNSRNNFRFFIITSENYYNEYQKKILKKYYNEEEKKKKSWIRILIDSNKNDQIKIQEKIEELILRLKLDKHEFSLDFQKMP